MKDINIKTIASNEKAIETLKAFGKQDTLGRYIGLTFGFQTKINRYLAIFSKGVILFEVSESEKGLYIDYIGVSSILKP